MPSIKVDLNPEILQWMRETIGDKRESVAIRLKIDPDIVKVWEENGREIPLSKLEQLASIYKRPLAAFFLSSKPEDAYQPKNFRTLPENQDLRLLSRETRLVLRKAQRLQSLAIELATQLGENAQGRIPRRKSQNPEALAEALRNYLEITIEQQVAWKEDREALSDWIRIMEKRNILVFQLSMPIKEIRGLSLRSERYPVIVLNVRDSSRGRIFTLFHEYAHLLLNEVGICDLGDEGYARGRVKVIEKYCNHFAGAFLVPEKPLLQHPLVKELPIHKSEFNKIIRILSNNFRVSREVVLRRLLILGKIPEDLYEEKAEEFRKEFKEIKPRGKGRWLVPYRKSLQERGNPFIGMAFEAKRTGKITTRDLADYLGIRKKHFKKLEKVVTKI